MGKPAKFLLGPSGANSTNAQELGKFANPQNIINYIFYMPISRNMWLHLDIYRG